VNEGTKYFHVYLMKRMTLHCCTLEYWSSKNMHTDDINYWEAFIRKLEKLLLAKAYICIRSCSLRKSMQDKYYGNGKYSGRTDRVS